MYHNIEVIIATTPMFYDLSKYCPKISSAIFPQQFIFIYLISISFLINPLFISSLGISLSVVFLLYQLSSSKRKNWAGNSQSYSFLVLSSLDSW